MADFQYRPLTHSAERINVISTKLGASAALADRFTMTEKLKAVVMSNKSNFILAPDGAEIEGFVDSVDDATAGGFTFGGVAHPDPGFRVEAKVGGATPLVFGDLVVAGVQPAIGTESLPVVKKGTPVNFKYRVINLYTGNGAVGSTVLLEKI